MYQVILGSVEPEGNKKVFEILGNKVTGYHAPVL
jgi:hypothetical protein